MPAFPFAAPELDAIVAFIGVLRAPAADHPAPGNPEAGGRFYSGKGNCTACHMVKGRGGTLGPDLSNLARERRLGQIEQALRDPGALALPGYRPVTVRLRDGQTLQGVAKNESGYDLQLESVDGTLHFFAKEQIASLAHEPKSLMQPVKATGEERQDLLAFLTRLGTEGAVPVSAPPAPPSTGGIPFSAIAAPKPGEWPTYHGQLSGNRHSPLREIDTQNVAHLAPKWMFPVAATPAAWR